MYADTDKNDSTLAYDFQIWSGAENALPLFTWESITGKTRFVKAENGMCQLECYTRLPVMDHDTLVYRDTLVYKVFYNQDKCEVKTHLVLDCRKNIPELIHTYKFYKDTYNTQEMALVPDSVWNRFNIFTADLMLAALGGSEECRKLYLALFEDLPFAMYVVPSWDYAGWRLLLKAEDGKP